MSEEHNFTPEIEAELQEEAIPEPSDAEETVEQPEEEFPSEAVQDEPEPEPEVEPEPLALEVEDDQPDSAHESGDEPDASLQEAQPAKTNPVMILYQQIEGRFGANGAKLVVGGAAALILIVIVLIVVLAARPAGNASTSASGSGEAEVAGQPAEGEETASDEPGSRVYGKGKLDSVPASWLDVNNIPTIRALTEAEGWQLETLLQQQGWVFDSSLEWLVDPLDAGLSFTGPSGRYDDEAIATFPAGGGKSPVVYLLTVPADVYETAEAAFKEVVQLTVDQQQWTDDTGIAVVSAPSQVKYLVLCVPDANGKYHSLMVFNVASLEAGMFDDLAGSNYGSTPDEVFSNMVNGMLAASSAPAEQAAPAQPAEPAPEAAPEAEPEAEPEPEE